MSEHSTSNSNYAPITYAFFDVVYMWNSPVRQSALDRLVRLIRSRDPNYRSPEQQRILDVSCFVIDSRNGRAAYDSYQELFHTIKNLYHKYSDPTIAYFQDMYEMLDLTQFAMRFDQTKPNDTTSESAEELSDKLSAMGI
jgi:hypothetical protein